MMHPYRRMNHNTEKGQIIGILDVCPFQTLAVIDLLGLLCARAEDDLFSETGYLLLSRGLPVGKEEIRFSDPEFFLCHCFQNMSQR